MKVELLKLIAEIARYYPSGDNIQCFFIELKNDKISINYNHEFGKHAVIFNEFSNLISLSHLLYYIEQAALHLKYDMKEVLLVDQLYFEKSLKVCEIEFFETKRKPDFSIEVLKKRHVDRRVLPNEITTEQWNIIKHFKKDHLHTYIDKHSNVAFINFLTKMDSLIYFWPKAAKDLLKYINSNSSTSKRGLKVNNLGITSIEIIATLVIKRFTILIPLAFNFLSAIFFRLNMKRIHKESQGHLIFSYDPNWNLQKKVECSKNICALWLKLTEMNISLQPHSFATLFCHPTRKGLQNKIDNQTKFKFQEIKKQTTFLNEYLNFPKGHEPLWLFRIGKPLSPIKETNRTNRIPVSDFLKVG